MRVVLRLMMGFAFASSAFAAVATPAISVRELTSPASARSLGASLTSGPDGTAWLSWVETGPSVSPAAESGHAASAPSIATNRVRVAAFDSERAVWGPAHTVVADPSVAASAADFPQVALNGGGELFALWTDGRGRAWISQSADRAATWTAPRPWATTGEVEKAALTRLSDGRVLAAWLDGRAKETGAKTTQLYARIVGDGAAGDQLVDGSVCDCCQTSLAPFLDGGALVAYRGRTPEEVRDISVARLHHGTWSQPRVLSADDWRIKACPVNGPRVASDGSRLAAAWFTGADNDPRVEASFSPDAGQRWLMPLRVDRGHPVGHVDTVLLRDAAFLVVWGEADGSVWLRRISPEFNVTDPVRLAAPGTASTQGVPRALLWRDYAGGHASATVLVAYTGEDGTGVHTLRVDVPEGDLVMAERNCDCAPTLEQLQGFAIRGRVTAIDASMHSAQATHGEVPGVFEAGTHVFAVDPHDFVGMQPGRQFLGRVEWRDGAWRLFDLRYLATK